MNATKSLVGLSLALAITVTFAVAVSGGTPRDPASRMRPMTVAPVSEASTINRGDRLRPALSAGEPTEAANQGRWRR